MHAYANAKHEQQVRDIFAVEYPEASLSLSSDVLPEYREYERAITTLVDAFVKPYMSRYLGNVHNELGPGLRDKPWTPTAPASCSRSMSTGRRCRCGQVPPSVALLLPA